VLLVVICGFLAVSLLAYALLNRPVPMAQQRLAALASGRRAEERVAAEDGPRSRSELLLVKLRAAMPAGYGERLDKLLYAAGMRMRPEVAVVVWAGTTIGLPLLYLLMAGAGSGGSRTVIFALILAGFGLYAPIALLKSRAGKRRKQILRAMPDMMDLLTTCVEAGLGLDAALARAGDKTKEPLGGEIRATLSSISMGTSRRRALEQLAARNGVSELTTFVTSLIQTESMGTSLGTALRVQAEAVRVARKQRAEQSAQKAPIKIIIVLVLLVFPSMFMVILGPAALAFTEKGGIL
jgi:tight adherence protein C